MKHQHTHIETKQGLFADESSYATVVIPLALPITYTWKIPSHLQTAAAIGVRVEVQLRNKKYAGVIKTISTTKPLFEPKEIINILDDDPLLYPAQLHTDLKTQRSPEALVIQLILMMRFH